ncbi:hypothetical protein G8759_32635 [Spirosoma aureum]|uniref:Uncharacterized protein n=1 Tax=Spirosoma aureum TaxID=2692134 RepID=A0A6G9AX57_9BACT|nr:hypothetical protein [Spirosoma aureum]QIP17047.1 hypothetical protein G8759_32635 [Spirosoma aureum]
MLPSLSRAQAKVSGLGNYIIGITTPDSLNRFDFKEEDQSYVKGTIALPCAHIRVFASDTVKIANLLVARLFLFFYDNTLFKLSCDYSDELKETLLNLYGTSVSRPAGSFQLCTKEAGKPLFMWGEAWQRADILALIMHREGYNADCIEEKGVRLTLFSQKFSALASDCDLSHTDPFMEEFSKLLNDHEKK